MQPTGESRTARQRDVDGVVERAREVASHRSGNTTVIAIDGPSGAGKTTLAEQVSAELDDCPVLHMDDLTPGWDGLAASVTALVDQVLRPLRSDRQIRYRRYDWLRGEPGTWVTVPVSAFLVIEGCGSSVGRAGELTDVRIWMEAETGQRRTRALTRDAGVFDAHWDRWAAQERALFNADGTRGKADVLIDTTR